MTTVHIYRVGESVRWRVTSCPVCEIADSVHIDATAHNAFYGSRLTCTNCGDSWHEGGMAERPFQRGWRQAAITRALADFEDACQCRVEFVDMFTVKPCKHEVAR